MALGQKLQHPGFFTGTVPEASRLPWVGYRRFDAPMPGYTSPGALPPMMRDYGADPATMRDYGGDPAALRPYGEFTSPVNLADDPGYQFRKREAIQLLGNRGSAMGIAKGGAAARALTRDVSQFASGEYGQAFNRAVTTHGLRRQSALDEFASGQYGDAYGRQHSLDMFEAARYGDTFRRQHALDLRGDALTQYGLRAEEARQRTAFGERGHDRALQRQALRRQRVIDRQNYALARHDRAQGAHQQRVNTWNSYMQSLLTKYGIDVGGLPGVNAPSAPAR